MSAVYVFTNNFLTVLFKGRCRRGGVTLRFNTMDSIIINLTYTQAPHSPLFPNPNYSKPATMQLWMSASYWKAKQNSTSTHTATCHLTETDVMFLHRPILLQQTSNTRNIRTLQETLQTNELKCQQLRYGACSDCRISPARQYKDPSSTRHDVHPYVANNQLESSVPLHSHQIRINPDMSTDLNTKYNSIWDMSQVSAAYDHDTSQVWGSSVS
jgi:hypothetical protein